MHAAASSSSSSIIRLLGAYKQSEKSQLHLWEICSGGGGARKKWSALIIISDHFKTFIFDLQLYVNVIVLCFPTFQDFEFLKS